MNSFGLLWDSLVFLLDSWLLEVSSDGLVLCLDVLLVDYIVVWNFSSIRCFVYPVPSGISVVSD